MNLLRACLDWRVIMVFGAVAIGVVGFAPNVIGATLPLLVLAACPIAMLLMMKTMGSHDRSVRRASASQPADRAEQIRSELAVSRRDQQRMMLELQEFEASRAVAVRSPESTSMPSD